MNWFLNFLIKEGERIWEGIVLPEFLKNKNFAKGKSPSFA
jgi:hypothetical protein